MTAPQEPQKLTLEEFIIRLAENGADLQYQPDAPPLAKRNPGYWVVDGRDAWGPYAAWEEAAQNTFGNVVPRDDAAELRAVLAEVMRVIGQHDDRGPHILPTPVWQRARAALAATERES